MNVSLSSLYFVNVYALNCNTQVLVYNLVYNVFIKGSNLKTQLHALLYLLSLHQLVPNPECIWNHFSISKKNTLFLCVSFKCRLKLGRMMLLRCGYI